MTGKPKSAGHSGVHPEVLRRKSYPAMSWVCTLFFGILGCAVAGLTTRTSGGPLAGSATAFIAVTVARRILGSRIILGDRVTVVNPLITYRMPYRAIREVSTNRSGTLTLMGADGEPVYASAFGGSLLDSFVGSTDRAVERINAARRAGTSRRTEPGATVKNHGMTHAWTADVFLALAIACAVAAVVIGV
ncbi:PH domain-containing protein [Streptomyces beijiangensis]|nr:PH domain-containing protein [Streptomyces beijiangensis]